MNATGQDPHQNRETVWSLAPSVANCLNHNLFRTISWLVYDVSRLIDVIDNSEGQPATQTHSNTVLTPFISSNQQNCITKWAAVWCNGGKDHDDDGGYADDGDDDDDSVTIHV